MREVGSLVGGMEIEHSGERVDEGCEACIGGKQHATPFLESTRRTKRCLELVHSDVCGKMDAKSLGGAEYFLTFMDDFSGYSWVYPIKKKSDVFAAFKRWRAEAENQSGLKLKILRTDNGGESGLHTEGGGPGIFPPQRKFSPPRKF